ncbi:MAG: LPS export ABC transporter permease LptG [Magnetovibrionaceae bacterium]
MRLSTTLSFYMGRHFLLAFLGLISLFLLLIFTFDIVELLRRAAARPHITIDLVIEMALLKLPNMAVRTFPFAILFGGMAAFWRLSRTHELVVTRAAGVSAWQFLFPVLLSAILLGIFQVALLGPFASSSLSRFERLETRLMEGKESSLAISSSGLWLRQATDEGQAVVHARHVLQQGDDVELWKIIIFRYQGADSFASRIEADYGRLEEGYWYLKDVRTYIPDHLAEDEDEFWLKTDLTITRIQDSFAPPETLSFWSLPGFIATLEEAGFSAVRHRLHFHVQLASPLLLCAMVLLAAAFTLKTSSRGGATYVILAGVMTGFMVHFTSDIVFALGLSDSIPVVLAAWSPSVVATLLGVAMLLHLEDG